MTRECDRNNSNNKEVSELVTVEDLVSDDTGQ